MTATKRFVHPVAQLSLNTISGEGLSSDRFEPWLKRWNTDLFMEERLGLLHGMIGKWICDEGICFLLETANRYTDPASGRDCLVVSISRKAFDVLCATFFGRSQSTWKEPQWWRGVLHITLFEKLLWFLREDNRRNCNVKADLTNHQHQVFRQFLVDFIKLGWDFERFREKYNLEYGEDTEARLVAARPDFIEIVNRLGMLRWLNGRKLDEVSLQKLTEIAMRESYSIPCRTSKDKRYREPECLEDALIGGSEAAEVVFLARIKEARCMALKKLYDANQQLREAEENLARLRE